MTSDKQKADGWEIPDPIDGYSEFVCYQVLVPNVREYRAAFMGTVRQLEKWWNWEKSYTPGDTRATQAANYWRNLLESLEPDNCEATLFDIRQKPDSPCIIQKTFTNGSIWLDAIDMTKCPVKVRINNGIVQWFNPGTGQWENTEGGDERTNGTYEPPWPTVPPGQNAACLTAANITAIYQTGLTQVRAGLEAGLIPVSIAAGLTGLASAFIPGAIFGAISLSICSAAFALGIAGLDDMLQQSHLDNFQCSLYCNAESDGTFTAAGFTAARSDMGSWASGIELTIIQTWLDGFGSVGLNRQGNAAGVTAANCEDCDCDVTGVWNWHVWGTHPDDDLNQFDASLSGLAFTGGYGVKISDTEFEPSSGYIFGDPQQEYYNLCIASRVMPDFLSAFGDELVIFARRMFIGDDPNGNFLQSTRIVEGAWISTGLGGTIPSDDAEFEFNSHNLTQDYNRVAYLVWIHSRSPFKITRIEVDGDPAP